MAAKTWLKNIVFLSLFLVAEGSLYKGWASSPLKIVATIKPIHSLVSAITQGVYTPHLLLSEMDSPHIFSLTPSQANLLGTADLVIWIGPACEGPLKRYITKVSPQGKVITLIHLPNLRIYPVRTGKFFGSGHHHHDAGSTGHNNHEMDGHIWLDPHNARKIVDHLLKELVNLDPANAPAYTRNAEHLIQKINLLDRKIWQDLAPTLGKPYLLFHDFMQYFDRHFKTKAVGVLTTDPDMPPRAHHLKEIKDQIYCSSDTDECISCVFFEPQFNIKVLKNTFQDLKLRTGILDPIGSPSIPPGPEAYFSMMEELAHNLKSCLDPESTIEGENEACLAQ